MSKDLTRLYTKKFGNRGGVKVHPTIIDHLEIFVSEPFGCCGPLHDMDVSFPFWWYDILLVQLDLDGGLVEAVSERL